MQRILKRLRGIFVGRQKTRVEISGERRNLRLTGANGHQITFISDLAEEAETQFVLQLSIFHERMTKPEQASVPVRIVGVRTLEKGVECTGLMINPPDHVVYLLERQFSDVESVEDAKRKRAPSGHELRQAERRERTFQVMSPDLRRFKAIALDISATGVRLQVEDQEEKGDIKTLHMDFDVHRMPVVSLQAEVMWCRPNPDDERTFLLGMRFVNMTPEKEAAVNRYLTYLSQVEKDWAEGRFPMR